ncbi:helix-turn-helix domain-containing protein [Clostridium sp. UBA6640]|uniref:helix-turn-helix domain-containing protein n=1 Tax=Clostridium sp. UBA6640 TaxID=1946370 RepID=UPI0025B837C7|nr:helix-turn-helix transcriptional regulator [Clostridium sp. UBA6640]
MNFGEKLFKLRKEKGLSQEALAEQIGTTRQAVSKWENNQGFPETEKLMMISNIFEVSVDFLLKESSITTESNDKEFYVSREMVGGYFANEKRVNKYIGIGFMFLLLSGIPYVMFANENSWRILGIAICVALGIGTFIMGAFKENEEYKILRQEPLLFDYDYLKELKTEYNTIKKKYQVIAIPCMFLLVLCMAIIFVTAKELISWTEYHSVAFLGSAVGLFGFIQSIGIIEMYELLVRNEQYCNRFWFRIRRKIKVKIDNF